VELEKKFSNVSAEFFAFLIEWLFSCECTCLLGIQGDQIGRIFAKWAITYIFWPIL
jgi:hypothetical protein